MTPPRKKGCVENLSEREEALKPWFIDTSQADLASELQVAQSHVSRIDNRENLPTVGWLEKRAAMLGIRPIVLLDWIYIRMGKSQKL